MTRALTDEQANRLADLLAERRAELSATIERHLAERERGRYRDLVGQVGDLEDHALAELLVDEELAGIQRELAELRAVQSAEARLAEGRCGHCIDCGQPIDFERLLAWPTAERCMPCQQAHEATHAQPGHHTL